MRSLRRTTILGLSLTLATMAGPALAGGPVDRTDGGVGWEGPRGMRHAGFNARATGSDSEARGQLEISERDGSSLHVDVRCLKVDGDTAWFGGEITKATGAFDPTDTREGQGLMTQVFDGGTPGRNGDQIGNRGATDANAACTMVESMTPATPNEVEKGDLRVHDAS